MPLKDWFTEFTEGDIKTQISVYQDVMKTWDIWQVRFQHELIEMVKTLVGWCLDERLDFYHRKAARKIKKYEDIIDTVFLWIRIKTVRKAASWKGFKYEVDIDWEIHEMPKKIMNILIILLREWLPLHLPTPTQRAYYYKLREYFPEGTLPWISWRKELSFQPWERLNRVVNGVRVRAVKKEKTRYTLSLISETTPGEGGEEIVLTERLYKVLGKVLNGGILNNTEEGYYYDLRTKMPKWFFENITVRKVWQSYKRKKK